MCDPDRFEKKSVSSRPCVLKCVYYNVQNDVVSIDFEIVYFFSGGMFCIRSLCMIFFIKISFVKFMRISSSEVC